jgi:diaminopimelate decarboxylase/aspartate kinase
MNASTRWVVLKFGGTSVSSRSNWDQIAGILRERQAEGLRTLVVHSAISGMTDALGDLLEHAQAGNPAVQLEGIARRHRELARELGVDASPLLDERLASLRKAADGVALLGEASDTVRARVMAQGELMSTALGAAYLNAQGIAVTLLDARSLLRAAPARGARQPVLSASCEFDPDPALQAGLARHPGILLTQGFIASGADGQTVLLGRGGSDTSAAYFAAKLGAARLEIWTDVPGMFSANPRSVPSARLLKCLDYDEAQEIATSGARVLHPRCIQPAKAHGIPIHVFATQNPRLAGTVIGTQAAATGARLKAIALRKGITLVSMDSPGMWQQVGFLADAFQVFKQHGLSVDLVSTSETHVTVSLDPQANLVDAEVLAALGADLSALCRVRVIGPCATLSLLGRDIRAILHRLGEALELFEEQRVYLVSQAANDLNFTFVLDEDQGDRLVMQLHDRLIRPVANDPVLGPTWEQLHEPERTTAERRSWWRRRSAELLEAFGTRSCAYAYDTGAVSGQAQALRGMRSLQRVYYAVKANPNPEILRTIAREGLSFECVSQEEVEHLIQVLPGLARERLLFTPNFAARAEYAWALDRDVAVTVDNLHVLCEWGGLFRGREILVRIDPGRGHGHHPKVRTAGTHSKFGVPLAELDALQAAARGAGAVIAGLHAHLGSGNFAIDTWVQTAEILAETATLLPDVRVLNLGGGLGVPDRHGQPPLDLAALDAALGTVRDRHPRYELWMEPGRYLVAGAGVLLARVTQLKGKGSVQYAGIATGMNSLIRPALYGAYHEIVNLTRLDKPADQLYDVVGPICESGDVLGHGRLLPRTREGDILLIANAGAYGHAMGSHYNLRPPAEELFV